MTAIASSSESMQATSAKPSLFHRMGWCAFSLWKSSWRQPLSATLKAETWRLSWRRLSSWPRVTSLLSKKALIWAHLTSITSRGGGRRDTGMSPAIMSSRRLHQFLPISITLSEARIRNQDRRHSWLLMSLTCSFRLRGWSTTCSIRETLSYTSATPWCAKSMR